MKLNLKDFKRIYPPCFPLPLPLQDFTTFFAWRKGGYKDHGFPRAQRDCDDSNTERALCFAVIGNWV